MPPPPPSPLCPQLSFQPDFTWLYVPNRTDLLCVSLRALLTRQVTLKLQERQLKHFSVFLFLSGQTGAPVWGCLEFQWKTTPHSCGEAGDVSSPAQVTFYYHDLSAKLWGETTNTFRKKKKKIIGLINMTCQHRLKCLFYISFKPGSKWLKNWDVGIKRDLCKLSPHWEPDGVGLMMCDSFRANWFDRSWLSSLCNISKLC